MSARILITGGAGFIGTHLANRLVDDGHEVRVLDVYDDQVHDAAGAPPLPLDRRVDVIEGDVGHPGVVRHALRGIDVVYHFAAAVGVGQSMYEIERYMRTNAVGTATLMEALVDRPVQRLVVASSMSIYGEGLYRDAEGLPVMNAKRSVQRMRAGDFEVRDARGEPLVPVATPESKQPQLASVYALSKYDQERLALIVGEAYGIETVALRFFNVYGPGQTLGNPYTGVLAIFGTRVLNGRAPIVFEDGRQQRDFVHVSDIVQACRLAMEAPDAVGQAINVGSGHPISIRELAEQMTRRLGAPGVVPEVTGRYRQGDVRHCYADITLARHLLGYQPRMDLEKGLGELESYLRECAAADRLEEHTEELRTRGLLA